MWRKLNEPFPEEENYLKNVRSIAGVSLFIFLFLYFVSPFGMHNFEGNLLGFSIGFGVVTFLCSLSYLTLFGEILKIKRNVPSWTLGRWILYMIGLLLFISIGNFFYLKIIHPNLELNFDNLLQMIYSTMVVGSLPVIFTGYSIQIRSDKKNQSAASDIQSQLKSSPIKTKKVRITSANEKQNIELTEDEFLFAESQQNYVVITFLKESKINEVTLRNTLKNIQGQLSGNPFFRCHQSYLVNTNQIENVSGNAQGLRLQLKNVGDTEIPVSRKYIKELKALLN